MVAQELFKLLQTRPNHTAGQYAVMLNESFTVVQRILSRWEKTSRVKKELEFPDRSEQSYSNQYLYRLNK